MTRLTVVSILLIVAACDAGSPSTSSTGSGGAPAGSGPPAATVTAGGAVATEPRRQTMVVSISQTGVDRSTFDYGSTDDVFVRLTFADESFDGRTLRLSVSPTGGGVLIAYQAQVVSGTATFDFAVSGTLFGRNAQPGHFTFRVSDVTTQATLGTRDVQFTSGGRP